VQSELPVTQENVAALIVPQGKVVDFVDGKLRNETPEEYVRQEIEKSIVREYQYPREEIEVEFRIKMGSSRKRVDLAIFPEGEAHSPDRVWAIIECKAEDVPPTHKKEGVEQLKTYLAACIRAQFGMWTNGRERVCLRKTEDLDFVEVVDLPVKGKSLDEAERPTLDALKAATSDALLFTFKRCHNYIAANQGLQKAEAFFELLKLIFCKILDERADELNFYATTQERQSLNGQMKVKARIARLFAEVKKRYRNIFKPNEVIDLEPRVLAYAVSQLQAYSLLESRIDVKGKAYEEIVGSNLRGDRGEFFTPRNICNMAVKMADPGREHVVLDPACGTGGFLVMAMNHVIKKIEEAEGKKWRGERGTDAQREELYRQKQEYMKEKLFGIDLNPNLVRAAKMNMVMNNDGSGGLFQGNSLAPAATWNEELRNRNLLGNVDFVFTNPPFGSKLPVDDPSILEQYDLGHVWDYDEETDVYLIREPRTLQKSQPPEILFIERCVQFAKQGKGIVCIVLPDAILGAPGLAYVREWVLQNTQVLASIDLHPDTFQPKNSTQTSLLVLRRKSFDQIERERFAGRKQDYSVFMALANHIGHDKRGVTIYVRDEDGNEVVETRTEREVEIHDRVPAYRDVETSYKVVDDNTEQVAARFRSWLEEQG
jgi:type I restriction enzyme M protein